MEFFGRDVAAGAVGGVQVVVAPERRAVGTLVPRAVRVARVELDALPFERLLGAAVRAGRVPLALVAAEEFGRDGADAEIARAAGDEPAAVGECGHAIISHPDNVYAGHEVDFVDERDANRVAHQRGAVADADDFARAAGEVARSDGAAVRFAAAGSPLKKRCEAGVRRDLGDSRLAEPAGERFVRLVDGERAGEGWNAWEASGLRMSRPFG